MYDTLHAYVCMFVCTYVCMCMYVCMVYILTFPYRIERASALEECLFADIVPSSVYNVMCYKYHKHVCMYVWYNCSRLVAAMSGSSQSSSGLCTLRTNSTGSSLKRLPEQKSIHTYIHTYIQYIHCIHTYIHTYIHACIHTCIHTCIRYTYRNRMDADTKKIRTYI